MEELLHYVWKHKIFPLEPLTTAEGEQVEVIDPGQRNTNAGPDFFNAKLKIGGVMWVGNVEIHDAASDWFRHGHDADSAYDNVILHVVAVADAVAVSKNGETVPTVVLTCPQQIKDKFDMLKQHDSYPACFSVAGKLPKLTVHSWMSALQAERFGQKAEVIAGRLARFGGDWEKTFFVTLARNFGFGLNGDAFETWANRLDLMAVRRHRDDMTQVEAVFFGMAGLLEAEIDDDYYRHLQTEFAFLTNKFGFQKPVDATNWKLLRVRPGNFPYIRIAQLAYLYHDSETLLSRLAGEESLHRVRELLLTRTSPYWEIHYLFGTESPRAVKALGTKSVDLIIINTVVPFLYAYGKFVGSEAMISRASQFLSELKAECNYITRLWARFGVVAENAADSQALVQLQKQYCDRRDCLRCRFGFEYLRDGSRRQT